MEHRYDEIAFKILGPGLAFHFALRSLFAVLNSYFFPQVLVDLVFKIQFSILIRQK